MADTREPSRSPTTGRMPAEEAVTAAEAVAKDPEMVELERRHTRFVWPTTIFFLIYYMALPVLVGYWPEVMKKPVWGKMNWAYLFAFSQFFMTWIVCALYVRAARTWDRMNTALLSKHV